MPVTKRSDSTKSEEDQFWDLKHKLMNQTKEFAEEVQPIYELKDWTHRGRGVPDVKKLNGLAYLLLTKLSWEEGKNRTHARSGRVTVEIRRCKHSDALEGTISLSSIVREREYK